MIYAYGVRDNFDYTLFRPFNFIGPNLDNVDEPKEGSSRVFTQFLSNIMYRRPILLVDGGEQKRSFTFIDDAMDCLLRIIDNPNGVASRRIFNIGNPANCASIKRAGRNDDRGGRGIPAAARARRSHHASRRSPRLTTTASTTRTSSCACRPSRPRARRLGWAPSTDLREAVRQTIAYYVKLEGTQRRAASPFVTAA